MTSPSVLKQIGFPKVDVIGYSFGGGVAFRLAVQHPADGAAAGPRVGRIRGGWLLSRDA